MSVFSAEENNCITFFFHLKTATSTQQPNCSLDRREDKDVSGQETKQRSHFTNLTSHATSGPAGKEM